MNAKARRVFGGLNMLAASTYLPTQLLVASADMDGMQRNGILDPEPSPILNDCAHRLIGAAIEVHRHLGPGLPESVYERALVVELETRRIASRRQVPIKVHYKDVLVGEVRLDLLVEDQLVVELKAIDAVASVHRAQMISYLRAGGFQLGLLINFNVSLLKNGIHRSRR